MFWTAKKKPEEKVKKRERETRRWRTQRSKPSFKNIRFSECLIYVCVFSPAYSTGKTRKQRKSEGERSGKGEEERVEIGGKEAPLQSLEFGKKGWILVF